jgi:hypothetical protein
MSVHLTYGRAPQAVAIRTQNWTLPEDATLSQGPEFKKAVEETITPPPEATAAPMLLPKFS